MVVRRTLLVLAVLLLIDSIWLGFIAPVFYDAQIGSLLRDNPNFFAAGLFYILYSFGIVYFALPRPNTKASAVHTASRGALLGLIAYGTYDLTNLAVLEGFTVTVAVVDIAWGAILTASVAAATQAIVTYKKGVR